MKKVIVFLGIILILLAACKRKDPMQEPAISAIPAEKEVSVLTATTTPSPVPTESVEEKDELFYLQEETKEAGASCAVAYLGYLEGDYTEFQNFLKESNYIRKYPFLTEVTCENTVIASGGEWYAIVSADEEVSLLVSSTTLDETQFTLVPEQELLQTNAGELLLVCGNVSDIFPSFIVTATDENGKAIEFSPCLSLKDGALNLYAGVYDFTIYSEEIYDEDIED